MQHVHEPASGPIEAGGEILRDSHVAALAKIIDATPAMLATMPAGSSAE
jgi:hypothetical protein